jgi:hypothetical protein
VLGCTAPILGASRQGTLKHSRATLRGGPVPAPCRALRCRRCRGRAQEYVGQGRRIGIEPHHGPEEELAQYGRPAVDVPAHVIGDCSAPSRLEHCHASGAHDVHRCAAVHVPVCAAKPGVHSRPDGALRLEPGLRPFTKASNLDGHQDHWVCTQDWDETQTSGERLPVEAQ